MFSSYIYIYIYVYIYITFIDAEFDVEASVNKVQIEDGVPVIMLSHEVAKTTWNKYTCIINGELYSKNLCMEMCGWSKIFLFCLSARILNCKITNSLIWNT